MGPEKEKLNKFGDEPINWYQLIKENKEIKEANEKLREDLGLTMSEERKLRTENAEYLARIAELEGLCENSCAIADERFELEKANKKFEARISALEKDLSKHFSAHQMSFKPGGES